jgi:hypothetical protein
VSSFRASATRSEIPKITDNFATWPELGVNAPYNPAPAPRISVTGAGFAIGSGNSIINHDYTGPNLNFAEDISWVKGAHQFGFGVNWLRISINYESGINATGLPTFNGSITGLSLADFMVGRPATWTQGNISYFYNRQNYVGTYAQDTWKLSRRITVSYGVRWEPFFPIRSKQGLFMRFDKGLYDQGVRSQVHVNAPAGLVFPGDTQWSSGNNIANYRWAEFVPRVGVVWDPQGDGKMTIRAAVGSYTDRSGLYALSSFGQDPPIGNVVTVNTPPDFSNPWATYPGDTVTPRGQNPLPITLSKNMPFPTNGAYITYPSDWKPLWVNQANVSIQRQFGSDWLLTANYIVNNTFHLVTENQLNAAQFIPGNCTANGVTSACSTLGNINQRRVLALQNPVLGAGYGIVAEGAPHGTGSYNGLFVSAQKRLSKGVSVLANYTWSHCISDVWNGQPGNNGVSTNTPQNRRADRGNCAPNLVSSDVRHLLNFSVVAQTPKFTGRTLRLLASGWQISPNVRLTSANFFNVTTGTDVALNGQSNQRPNLVDPSKVYVANKSVDGWISASAFANPATGTLGNLGTNNLRGPGLIQINLGVSRTFQIREKQSLQVRGETFNLPNHLNPAAPVSALNSSVFGKIQSDVSGTSGLSAGDQRIIQIALKFMF